MTSLGYLQRSFGELISSTDREEAYEVGRGCRSRCCCWDSDKEVVLVRVPAPTYRIEGRLAAT